MGFTCTEAYTTPFGDQPAGVYVTIKGAIRQITKRFNDQGQCVWSISTEYFVFLNSAYAGKQPYKKEFVTAEVTQANPPADPWGAVYAHLKANQFADFTCVDA